MHCLDTEAIYAGRAVTEQALLTRSGDIRIDMAQSGAAVMAGSAGALGGRRIPVGGIFEQRLAVGFRGRFLVADCAVLDVARIRALIEIDTVDLE